MVAPASPARDARQRGATLLSALSRPIPIGVDHFRTLRERGMESVDKSHLVREVLDKGAQALLLPAPGVSARRSP